MAEHQAACPICEALERARQGRHAGFVAEMETGVVVLGEDQYHRGYCLLLCKTPATELDELPPATRLRYLEEMALLAEAVRAVVKPHKLNYECLGNQAHHLHWHIFPRTLDEPNPTAPVWLDMPPPAQGPRVPLDPERHAPLAAALREHLQRLTSR